jgi:hypothetical protein
VITSTFLEVVQAPVVAALALTGFAQSIGKNMKIDLISENYKYFNFKLGWKVLKF